MKMVSEIIKGMCPTTILLNIGAIGISLTEVEIGLKIISYIVAIGYTTIKIINETRAWKKKRKQK